jgi:4-hydroxy-tetrahydrodipicolinate reductase
VELGSGFERKDHADIGKDVGINAGIPEKGVKIEDSPGSAKACRVSIDFTVPEALEENLKYCEANNINLVIGTTGLSDGQKKALKAASEKIAVVFAPNMGVGINVLLNVVKNISATLGDNYDIEIIEAHHNKKKDSPSGSALGLAEAAAQGRGLSVKDHAVYGRQGAVGARKKDEIGIHAIRGGDIIGEHTVLFSGAGCWTRIKDSITCRTCWGWLAS